MNYQFVLRKLFLLLFLITTMTELAANPSRQAEQQIEAIYQKMESQMLESNQLMKKGDYQKAQSLTYDLIGDLDALIENVMPLDKRIQKLIEDQTTIRNKTAQSSLYAAPKKTGENADNRLEELIHDQIVNREKTEKAIRLTGQLKENEQEGASANQNKKEDKRAKLEKVGRYLNQSVLHQTGAIDQLEEKQLKVAEQQENAAIDSLKKALEELKGKQSGGNQANQQEKNQDNPSKPDNQQNSDSKQSQANQNNDKQTSKTEQAQNKMNPTEALKQLYKLRKQANEEMEKRKRQYGVQSTGEKYPVEKDW